MFRSKHLPQKPPHSFPVDVDQFLAQQVGDHPSFYQVMQGHHNSDEDDFNTQYLPGFSMSYIFYYTIGNQHDEFKKENKGDEAKKFDNPSWNTQTSEQYQDDENNDHQDDDGGILNLVPALGLQFFPLLCFFSLFCGIVNFHQQKVIFLGNQGKAVGYILEYRTKDYLPGQLLV